MKKKSARTVSFVVTLGTALAATAAHAGVATTIPEPEIISLLAVGAIVFAIVSRIRRK